MLLGNKVSRLVLDEQERCDVSSATDWKHLFSLLQHQVATHTFLRSTTPKPLAAALRVPTTPMRAMTAI